MKAYIYSSDQRILPFLAKQYTIIQWIGLDHAMEIGKMSETEELVFVLHSPIKVDSKLISPESIWKKYLGLKFPRSKFIVAGVKEAQQSNYLDLLNLPEDFRQFTIQAFQAKDDWQPINTGAVDLGQKLHSFLKGHGEESIIFILTKIQSSLYNTLQVAEADPLFSDLPQLWQAFENRWQKYLFLFSCLPFFDLFENSNALIQILNPHFKPTSFKQMEIKDIEHVYKIVTIIDELMCKINSYA